MDKPIYLVTGAAGFVGMQIVKELRSHDIAVRALVRQEKQIKLFEPMGVEAVLCDIQDRDRLRECMEGIRGVYHIAALFRQADQPDSAYYDINVQGVRNVLETAAEAGVQRVVHCSTVGVLGHIEHPPANEDTPYNPGDIYQRTKMEGEKIAMEAFKSGQVNGAVIRPAMIYGPGDTRTLKMFKMIAKGRFFYAGKGANLVHFIDVRDLARSFRLAMERPERNGELYIIAGERAMPLKELCDKTAEILGVSPPWIKVPVKPLQWLGSICEAICIPLKINPPIYRRRVDFYTKDRSFDGSKAAEQLGFKPAQSPEKEFKDIVADYKERGWLA